MCKKCNEESTRNRQEVCQKYRGPRWCVSWRAICSIHCLAPAKPTLGTKGGVYPCLGMLSGSKLVALGKIWTPVETTVSLTLLLEILTHIWGMAGYFSLALQVILMQPVGWHLETKHIIWSDILFKTAGYELLSKPSESHYAHINKMKHILFESFFNQLSSKDMLNFFVQYKLHQNWTKYLERLEVVALGRYLMNGYSLKDNWLLYSLNCSWKKIQGEKKKRHSSWFLFL